MRQASPAAVTPAGIEARPFSRFVPVAALLFLFLYSGFCLQALPVVAPLMLRDWGMAARSLATPLALTSIGTGLGAMLGGFIGDAKGRKAPIICFAALQGVGMTLTGFAASLATLDILMFVIGFALGGYFPSGMALMTELAPARRRGLMVSLAILFGPIGLGVCSFLAGLLAPRYGWPLLFFVGGGGGVVLVLALIAFVPESPRYLARFTARRGERARIMARFGLADQENPVPADGATAEKISALTLLRSRLFLTLVLWLLFFLYYILGSIVLGWIPVVFSSARFPVWMASQSLFYWTIGSVIGTPLAGWVIGRIGVYDTAVLFSMAAVAVIGVLAFVKLDPTWAWLIMTTLPVAGFAVSGVVTSLYTMAADFYPSAMRATGIGLADAVGRIGGVLGAFVGVFALDLAGVSGFFFLIWCLALAAFGIFALLRGRGRPVVAD